jgi:hypothetical protein
MYSALLWHGMKNFTAFSKGLYYLSFSVSLPLNTYQKTLDKCWMSMKAAVVKP